MLEAQVPADAFTAAALGTDRLGNGIVLGTEGLVLTIGYLLMEADSVTLTANDGREVPAHVLGSDPATGFGLLQALEPLRLPGLPLGDSRRLKAGSPVILAGGGGRAHAAAGQVLARQRFAGYWEYLLDDAIITEPAHPHWSGAALIGAAGELMGVGSLTMQHRTADGGIATNNLFVPSELLPPILDDLAHGRPAQPPRALARALRPGHRPPRADHRRQSRRPGRARRTAPGGRHPGGRRDRGPATSATSTRACGPAAPPGRRSPCRCSGRAMSSTWRSGRPTAWR